MKTVLRSDESKFEIVFGKHGRRRVVQVKEEKNRQACCCRTVQQPASVMVGLLEVGRQ